MFIAIFRLVGLVAILAVYILWIVTLINSDGRCHLDNCDGCPYDPKECPVKERKRHEERNEKDER